MAHSSPPTSPPAFWASTSAPSSPSPPASPAATHIALEDHSLLPCGEWAAAVSIPDYTVVSGPTGIGAYVVWTIRLETLKGAPFELRRRYSEFDALRQKLVEAFPHAEGAVPKLPRKSVVSRFRARFLESRRVGLEHFLHCVLLHPEFAGSTMVREFVFGS